MPKRTKVDSGPIISTFKKTGSKRETARILGIHENTVYTHLRGAKNKCIRCGRSPRRGHKHCPACLKTLREASKRKRVERGKLGLCRQCDEKVQPPSRLYCSLHRAKMLAANRKYYKGKKQSRPILIYRGAPADTKEKRIGYVYGPGGVAEWYSCEGRCRICSISHKERPMHIHHVDCDPKNNSKENLKGLCQRCHKLVHKLIRHPDPSRLISWIHDHYPHLSF